MSQPARDRPPWATVGAHGATFAPFGDLAT